MVRYTVVWNDDTLEQLARIWVRSADKSAVTAAVAELDSRLSRDAPTKGTDILHGIRSLSATPLRVLFTVSEPDRLVRVVHVGILTER
jgi:hypothetical protein